MNLPGSISSAVPDGPDWLVREVRTLRQEIAALRTAQTIQTVATSAVQVALGYDQQSNFKVSHPNGVTVATASLTLPDNADGGEYEQVLVTADIWAGFYNGSTSDDNAYVELQFRENPAWTIQQCTTTPASHAMTIPVGYSFIATPANLAGLLPGHTMHFDAIVNSQVADWPATAQNQVYIRALAICIR